MFEETAADKVSRLRAQFGVRKKVNPFSWMVDKICGVNLDDRHDPYRDEIPPVVRIALVSMPYLRVGHDFDVARFSSIRSGTEPPPGVTPASCARALVSLKSDAAERMLRIFRDALDAALRFHPHVICFNELGLPSANMVPLLVVKDLAWQTSQTHKVLIVAGSAHDAATLYNTAYVFRPGGPREGEGFHKTVSARDEGELISAPASRSIMAVKFAGLRIAMMICLDVVDYAAIASVVKVSDGLDVLLVACYTRKFDDITSIAKVASRAMPGVVGLVNAVGPEWNAKNCQIACFGDSSAPSKEKKKSGAIISLLEIDHDKFQERRIDLKTPKYPDDKPETDRDPEKQKKIDEIEEMEYLFGRRDMPVVRAP